MLPNRRFGYSVKNGHARIAAIPKKERKKIATVKHRDVVRSSSIIDDDNKISQLTQESQLSQQSHETDDSKFLNTASK